MNWKCIIFWLMFPFLAQAQKPYFTHYYTINGLLGNNCYDIMQDSKGFIWVGTSSGVSRFDGITFENFTIDNGLPDNEILKIYEDSQHRIWFLALNGDLSYFKDEVIYSAKNEPLLAKIKLKSAIVSFFEDSKKRIWLSYNSNNVGLIAQQKFSLMTVPHIANAAFTETKTGQIIALNNYATFEYHDAVFVPKVGKTLPISYHAITPIGGNELVFLSPNGELFHYQNGNSKLINHIKPEFYNPESNIFYTRGHQLEDIWITNNYGIRYFTKENQTLNFLPQVKISKVIQAKDGNYWFSTNDGIYLLPNRDERYYFYNKIESDLYSNSVKSVTMDAKNRLWMGFNDGYINVLSENKLVNSIKIKGIDNANIIKQLYFDIANNCIYFCTDFDFGLITDIYSKNPKVNIANFQSLGKFALKKFFVKDKNIALSTSSGVYSIENMNFPLKNNFAPQLKFHVSDRSYSVFMDHWNHLWYANNKGINELVGKEIIPHYKNNDLLSKRINDIKELSDGTMVLATDGYGILLYKNSRILAQLNTINGLSSNICRKILVQNDTIWTETSKGCNLIVKNKEQYDIKNLNFIHAEVSDRLNDIYIAENQNLGYLASDEGLIYFTKNHQGVPKPLPKVYLKSIKNNGFNIDIQGDIKLKANQNNLTINFAVISFNNTSNSYRYRLNDENWNEINTTKIEFASLLPGKYKLYIRANKNNGEWSPPTLINFEIATPLWFKWWFVLIVFVVFTFIIYQIITLILQRQRARERQELLSKNKILALEQQALQAMMNPHFVFNVMNAIQYFINTKDNTGANKMLTGFARLIRKNLDICTKSYISLQEEMEYLELYLKLEKSRFGDKLNYKIKIDERINPNEVLIPTMILQPFVENSVWHGIMPKKNGGNIEIHIEKMQGQKKISIKIIDDGIGIDNSLEQKKSTHVSKGMSITKERLALIGQIEKKNISLNMEQNGTQGTTVILEIPIFLP